MSAFTRIHSDKLAKFSFSHGAVIHPNAHTIVLAGKVGSIDLKGKMAATFEEQVAATFKNIETALAEVGATPKDIVHMRYYVTDVRKWLTLRSANKAKGTPTCSDTESQRPETW
jgi:enamine deaminase RidA (YjgF/YER057c/UK114 family)